jgi:hypothetical protein
MALQKLWADPSRRRPEPSEWWDGAVAPRRARTRSRRDVRRPTSVCVPARRDSNAHAAPPAAARRTHAEGDTRRWGHMIKQFRQKSTQTVDRLPIGRLYGISASNRREKNRITKRPGPRAPRAERRRESVSLRVRPDVKRSEASRVLRSSGRLPPVRAPNGTSDLRDRGCPISALRPPRRPPLRVASPLRAHGNGTAARSPPVAARRPSAAPSAVRPDRTAPNPRNRRSRKPSAASAAWRALPSRCLGRVSAGGWLWLCCASIVCGVPCVAGGGRGSGSARTERSRTASKLISALDGKAANARQSNPPAPADDNHAV